MQLPSKLKSGDTLSAAWLNAIRDCLSALDKQIARRRLLKGTGYLVRESAGGTTLTINNQGVYQKQREESEACEMPFDVTLSTIADTEINDSGEVVDTTDGSTQTVYTVKGGLIYIDGQNYCEIPDKTAGNPIEEDVETGYIVLNASMSGSTLHYSFTVEEEIEGNKLTPSETI